MPKTRTYCQTQIDELSRKLKEAPAPERKLSTKQAVKALKDDLLEKQRQGSTLRGLAEWLSANDFAISASALGDYLGEDDKTKGTKKARTKTAIKPKSRAAAPVTPMAATRTGVANVTQPDGARAPDEPEQQQRLPLAGLVETK
ncbi:hypothetical protein [Azospirillum sp.]|uniref:hypothetical protein n=1 Tax=Azospirillum sp. TaxID=34012 RepID=UPI002D623191|nr:hypothetical protein [Azospirillum sp.]HYF85012.1 hypothetical protein [Azospirillum sp.]